MANVAEHYFDNSYCNLYVKKCNRISNNLVSGIIESGIFNNTYYLNYDESKPCFSHPIKSILDDRHSYRMFMSDLISGERLNEPTSHLITFGLWGDAGYVVDYFISRNPDLKLSFVEEGTANYYLKRIDYSSFGRNLMFLQSVQWFGRTFTDKKRKIPEYLKHAENLYLYQPTACITDNEFSLYSIPPISESKALMNLLNNYIKTIDITNYSRKYIYLLQSWAEYDSDYQDTASQVNTLIEIFGGKNIVFKSHPKSGIDMHHDFPWDMYPKDIFVDSQSYWFESIIPIIDIEDKVLITCDSSMVMYPKYMFDKEPIVIYTYNLFEMDTEKKARVENNVMHLRAQYRDGGRVYNPKDVEEFKSLLLKLNNSEY